MTFAIGVIFLQLVCVKQVLAQPFSIKLFDANSTFATGHQNFPEDAVSFATTSLILQFTPGDTAVISSTPDGTGSFVVDNFLLINGKNVCFGIDSSCFGPQLRSNWSPGDPIDTVLTPIPPLDVTASIPLGYSTVLFDLRDFGVIAGNTELFLVTTARPVAPRLPPTTVGDAIDNIIDLGTAQLVAEIGARFKAAFEVDVITPIIQGLEDRGTAPEIIAEVRKQLGQASVEWAGVAGIAVDSALDTKTLFNQLARRLGTIYHLPLPALASISGFAINDSIPTISANQSIDDILLVGFDSSKVTFSWQNLSAEMSFTQPAPFDAVAGVLAQDGGTVSMEMTASANPSGVKAEATVNVQGTAGGTDFKIGVGTGVQSDSNGTNWNIVGKGEVKC